MIEPDDTGHDEPWTDGHRPHTCGAYVEQHALKYRRQPDGSALSYWECPVV